MELFPLRDESEELWKFVFLFLFMSILYVIKLKE